MSRFWPLLLLLLAPARGEEPPCVIPKGPPCITMAELREKLDGRHCVFQEESCITFQWDEYGKVIILEAEIHVTPACSNPSATTAFEQKGRQYLGSLQTIPIDVKVIIEKCAAKGFVDVKVTRTSA